MLKCKKVVVERGSRFLMLFLISGYYANEGSKGIVQPKQLEEAE